MRLHNKTDYDIKTLQERLLDNLEAIHQTCIQHGLTYYLWAGTMLGAVRHKGFIPWDDDMDICMPRPDYELLMAHWREWLPKPYAVISTDTDTTYPYPFAKIEDTSTTVQERPDFPFLEGIYIDVFPLDGMPESRLRQKLHYMRYHFWRHLLFFRGRDPYKHGRGPRSWLPRLIHACWSLEGLQRKVKRLMMKYPYDKCRLVLDYDDHLRGIIDKSLLGTPQPMDFQGHTFMGVEHAHEYLTQKYGDYMTLPPKERQIQHHLYYLNLETPYKSYGHE